MALMSFLSSLFSGIRGDFYVEPKYNGIEFQVHRKGDGLKLFADGSSDITHELLNIARAEFPIRIELLMFPSGF